MLVLSRFRKEEIVLTENGREIARVMVVDVKGDKVRLGINAPKSVQVDRAEILKDKQENPR